MSPEEPLVVLALKGLRHQRSEPGTVFARRLQQLENNKQPNISRNNAHSPQLLLSSGRNYSITVSEARRRPESERERGSEAHLVLGPGDGVHRDGPPR